MDYIEVTETALATTAVKNFYPCSREMPATAADTSALEAWTGFKPNTPVKDGVSRFVTCTGSSRRMKFITTHFAI